MYIKVLVTVGSKRELLEKKKDDHFKIKVREKAKRNAANRRVVEILAEYYHLPIGNVRIVNGHHHPSKLVDISMRE